MLKLKVCGMRSNKNIIALTKVQPDFMGFIFHSKSPRNISEPITNNAPRDISRVGVFVDESIEFILSKTKSYNLNCIQLHGKESPEYCEEIKKLGFGVIKAFNLSEHFNFSIVKAYEQHCNYFLFDAFGKKAGGNGVLFNWQLISKYTGNTPFLLSGGIDETMVEKIKKIKHPQLIGVDINSGFETETALKDIAKINRFSNSIKN